MRLREYNELLSYWESRSREIEGFLTGFEDWSSKGNYSEIPYEVRVVLAYGTQSLEESLVRAKENIDKVRKDIDSYKEK
jgi:hypothetical protein